MTSELNEPPQKVQLSHEAKIRVKEAIRILEEQIYSQGLDCSTRTHLFWCLASIEKRFFGDDTGPRTR